MPFHTGGPRPPRQAAPTPPVPVLPPVQPPAATHPALSSPLVVGPAELPRILVLDRFSPGFALLDESNRCVSEEGKLAPLHDALPALEALGGEHAHDAHFVCYGILPPDGVQAELVPRLTKGVIPSLDSYADAGQIRVRSADVVGVAVALDYDLPAHIRWTESTIEEAKRSFAEVGQRDPRFAQPSLWYTTSGGCRFVWLLAGAIEIEGALGLEDLLMGMVAAAHMAGLAVDPACRDWTRLFRLPRVRRGDKPPAEARTQEQPYFRMSWGCVDFNARQPTTPAQVIVWPRERFTAISSLSLADLQVNEASKRLGDRWQHMIGRAPSSSAARQAAIHLGGVPSDVEVQQALTLDGKQDTPLARRVRRLLESRAAPAAKNAKPWPSAVEAVDRLYGTTPLFAHPQEQEGLHEGMLKLCRALCYTLREQLGEGPGEVSPTLLFALVIQAMRRSDAMRPPEKRRSDSELKSEVWRALGHVYRQHRFITMQALEDRAQEEAAAHVKAMNSRLLADAAERTIRETLKAWVRESLPREQQRADAVEQGAVTMTSFLDQWVDANWRNLLILETPQEGRAVLRFLPNGQVTYSKLARTDGALAAEIRDCGHDLIALHKPAATPSGDPVMKTAAALLFEHGSAASVSYSRLEKLSKLRVALTNDGDVHVHLIALAAGTRRDVEPAHDPLVHEWLCLLGGNQSDKLLDWLACYPLLERPIAGLYLEGAPDIGKGMLARALANLTANRIWAPFHEVLDQFQDTMRKTPFVWADEESSSATRSTRSVMNLFKKLVTGELANLNAKGREPVHVDGNWRVLLTANSDKLLAFDEDVNENDLGALIQRTLHILCDSDRARDFLRKLGGRAGTEGWPESKIPQHIMWLAKTREVVPGSRLYVEGERTDFHEQLAVNTGGTDLIVRSLGHMLTHPDKYPAALRTREEDDGLHVYVNAQAFRGTLVSMHSSDRSVNVPQARRLQESLKHLSRRKHSVNVWGLRGGRDVSRMWDLNVTAVIQQLYHMGADFDLRQSLGEKAWAQLAPETVRDAIVQAEREHVNGHANGAARGRRVQADVNVHPLVGASPQQPQVIIQTPQPASTPVPASEISKRHFFTPTGAS